MAKTKKRLVRLEFPLGGLNRRFGYRNQPPYTTPDALNVRPFDTLAGRARGGSRPGLQKAYYEELGSGAAVRMLSSVSYVKGDGFTFWLDEFTEDTLGDLWSAAAWESDGAPGIYPDDEDDVDFNEDVGAVRDALTLDVSGVYQLELYIQTYKGEHHGTYKIYLRMDDTTPALETAGVQAELTMAGDNKAYDGKLTVWVAGTPTEYAFTAGADDEPTSGWFKVLVNGDTVSCYWNGNTLVAQDISAHGAAAGKRFGFGMLCTESGGVCKVGSFRIQYYEDATFTEQELRTLLVASSNGELWHESATVGEMEQLSTNLTLRDDIPLQAAERSSLLYIADNGDLRKTANSGVIGGAGADELSDAGVDMTTLGIDTDDDVVVISNGTGAVTDGTYQISAVIAAKVTLASAPGAGNCTYRIERAPKVFDPDAGTLAIWDSGDEANPVPSGCPLVCRYRDRMVVGAQPTAPHLWYMSRLGDPNDWDYSQTDVSRAVSGQNAEAGQIGEPLTAMIPHSDDYLVFGCANSLWILRGDPAMSGMIDCLSHQIGIVDKEAWCRGPASELIFLSRDGLYMLSPGATSYPESISREKIPNELLELDSQVYTVSLAYDTRDRGVHIFITSVETQTHVHYWFDWEFKSFWPVTLQSAHEPTALFNFRSQIAADSAVLAGGRDGHLRRFQRSAETDDGGNEIESYVFYGPLRAGGDDYTEGLITELIGAVGLGSGKVDWSVMTATTHEAVLTAAAGSTGTWEAGLNAKRRPRDRGGSILLKVENGEPNRAWAMERIGAVLKRAGKQRV